MKRWLLILCVLSVVRVGQARPMPTLDIDALLFLSECVIEGPIVAARTQNYERSADVRVEKTWVGANVVGQMVTIGDLSLYRKGEVWIRYARLEERVVNGKKVGQYVTLPPQQQPKMTQLDRTDRAIFFLSKPSRRNSPSQKVDFWALPSGVRLVRENRVSGFTQMSNPGGYSEIRGTTRAAFDAGFAASLTRIGVLKTRLQAPARIEDARYFESWKASRTKNTPRRGFNFGLGVDPITQALDERLKLIAQLKSRAAQTR